MTAHLSVERLSAYLDRELAAPEARLVERHLRDCYTCREHLESLQRVVGKLERLDRMAPPPLLMGEVARRVALEGRPRTLVERLESRLPKRALESSTLTTFALVMALVTIGFLFVDTVERIERKRIPVLVVTPEASTEFSRQHELRTGLRVEVAGRSFVLREDAWLEESLESIDAAVVLAAGTPEAEALLARYPELDHLLKEGREVILEDEGRLLRLLPSEAVADPGVASPN